MKRINLVIITLLTASIAVMAQNFTVDDWTYSSWTWEDSYYAQLEATNATGDVVVPDTVVYEGNTYYITSIAYGAFGGNTEVTSVKLGNNINSIASWAFSGCTSLESINIPQWVSQFWGGTFRNCPALKTVTIEGTTAFTYNNTEYLDFAETWSDDLTFIVPYGCSSTFADLAAYGTVIEAEPQSITGDVNGDGVIDVSDANLTINVMLGKTTQSEYPAADVNGDDVIDVTDVNLIINIMLGK